MKKNIFHRWRLRDIPTRRGTCALCGNKDVAIVGFDHDIAAITAGCGEICNACYCPVHQAEAALLNAGLVVPTDSILEDHS